MTPARGRRGGPGSYHAAERIRGGEPGSVESERRNAWERLCLARKWGGKTAADRFDWYGFDDALYAAARLLEILAASRESPTERIAALPRGISTPEIRVEMREGEPERFMERLLDALPGAPGFDDARLDTLDGVRIELADGWALVRASNTSPSLALRLEADSEAALDRIAGDVRRLLLRLGPDLEIPLRTP